jgi:3'-5' exoribonuclease
MNNSTISVTQKIQWLEDKAKAIEGSNPTELAGYTKLVYGLIHDTKFKVWSGCINEKHHYGDHGLLIHSYEVAMLALSVRKQLQKDDVDEAELFLACLYHDSGKTRDYELVDGKWVGTDHKRHIHHISRSALIWSHAVKEYPNLNDKYHDSVLHAILSHHGLREWGSPVSPKTKTAWLLHLCDGLSARLEDADRVDLR